MFTHQLLEDQFYKTLVSFGFRMMTLFCASPLVVVAFRGVVVDRLLTLARHDMHIEGREAVPQIRRDIRVRDMVKNNRVAG